jgi:VWFA-related protein
MTRKHSSAITRFLLLVAVTSLLLFPALAQQQSAPPPAQPGSAQQAPPPAQKNDNLIDLKRLPPPPPPETTKTGKNSLVVHTDLVQIDAIVTDRNGKIIKGLKPENFQLVEEGKVQKLEKLDYFDVEKIETAEKDDSAPIVVNLKTSNNPDTLRPIVMDHRMIVLFFDLTSLQPEDLLRSTGAAIKFIKDQMTKADLVAVVSFGTQFRINSEFTNDKDTLLRAVTSLIPGKESGLAGAAATANDAVTEDTGAAFAADETEFNIFNTDNKLYAIEALANLLGKIPGRKSVLQFTGGVTQTGEDNRSQLQAATNAANKNNVSLYQMDSRGLVAETPGGDSSTGMASGRGSFNGAAVFQQTQSRQDSRDTLSTLAQDTGGKAFFDVGDFTEVFKQVQDDSTGYYLLSYYSTNLARDGRYRGVKVKLVGIPPGAHIRHREGYYGPKDWGIFTTEDREKQLDEAMGSEMARQELPVALDTGEFRLANSQIFVPISAKLSSSALQWAEKSGRHEARFDFLYEVREVTTRRVVGSQRETMTVRLDTDRFQQLAQQAIVYQGGIQLGPGHYKLKFLARENETGRMGTFEQDLLLLPAQANKLQLSSVLLSSQLAEIPKSNEVQKRTLGIDAKMKDSPLDVGGQRIVPSVTRVFTSAQTLYVFFQAYCPPKTDPNTLRAGLVFFVNGRRYDETSVVEPAEVDAKTHAASFRISLPLEKLPQGRYTVQAVVIEAGGTQSAFGRNYFALRKPAAAAPAAPPAAPGGNTNSGSR